MKKKKKSNGRLGKIIIGTVGLLFLTYGAFLTLLWLSGSPIQAKVTHFRREGGERNETIRNNYTYSYSYEFNVDGKTYSGNSKKVQGPVFVNSGESRFIRIYYLKCCPFLNGPETDFSPKYKILIYFGVAALLFYFVPKLK